MFIVDNFRLILEHGNIRNTCLTQLCTIVLSEY